MKRRYVVMMLSVMVVTFAFLVKTTNATPSLLNTEPTLKISCESKLSGGEKSECKVTVFEGPKEEVAIKLASTNPGLLQLEANEVKLLPGQSFAKVLITTSPTPIRTTVVIKANLSTDNQIQAEKSIELVPALMASAQLTAGSFVGTHGAKTLCSVRLKAPAPPGGIQLYLSPLKVSPGLLTTRDPVTLQVPNPIVPAGKDGIDFQIPYDGLYQGSESVSRFGVSDFDSQSRTVELVVALDPQVTKQWVAIAGIAKKVTFEVVPLRVNSLSVQPTTLNGGEALATFTLSAPPGNSESAYLRPIKTSGASKLWAVPLGVSCAAAGPTNVTAESNELPLVQGTSTYQFKVCSATVSTIETRNVSVQLRSGRFDAPVTIQP